VGKKKIKDTSPPYQRKQPGKHKGYKAERGVPLYHNELKKRISIMLTPTAIDILGKMAEETENSRSEFLEKLLKEIQKRRGMPLAGSFSDWELLRFVDKGV